MKTKLTLFVPILLLCSSLSFCQEGKFYFGIFSGASLNNNSYEFENGNSSFDTSYSNDIKPAFNLGMFLNYDIASNFGVRLQGQYTNKGGISKVNTFYGNELTLIDRTYKSTINYFQFSLLPQLYIPFTRSAADQKAYFNAGGYLSFKLSATESIDNETLLQNWNTEKDISNNVTGTDAGLIFGAGIIYKGFLFDIRYDLGLTNIVEAADLKDVLSIKNRSINFSIGWTGGL